MGDRLRTLAQEQAHLKLMMALEELETDRRDARLRDALIPSDWGSLETKAPVRPAAKR